jgi:hypothetical protein
MVVASKDFRDHAARTLRASRKVRAGSERTVLMYVADAYKALAYDQERRRGEPEKSRKRPAKK